MRVCAFGSFDKAFDRSWILLEALEQSGAEVVYCHFDLWKNHRHKTNLFPWRWLLLAGRYLAGLLSISIQFLRSPRADVLYVGYLGHVDLLFAACLNWHRRSTVVFDPCISLYNTLVEDRQIVRANGFVANMIRRLDAVPCRLADVVFIDTECHGQYFENALGVAAGKIHRVFVGAGAAWQQSRWSPAEGPFIVLFYAKFSPLHGIAVILDAVERLKGENVHFTIVGGGQLEETVRDAVDRLRLSTLEWIPWLERDALIDQMGRCHVNLGIFGTTTKASMVIPNKVFQAMAMGVPVITRDSPAIRELVEDGRSAVLCGTDGADLADAILACRDDLDRLKSMGDRGREVFRERASHRAIADQVFKALHAR